MRFSYLVILIEFLFINIVLLGQEKTNWKQVKESDNIKAYVQKLHSSQLKKVKVETILDATLSELVSIIKDVDNHNNWVYYIERSEIIEKTDDFHWKYYGYSNPPWPVSNRDFITEVTLEQNEQDSSIIITSEAIPDYLPTTKGCVRIPYLSSVWYLVPLRNDSIFISLEIVADIGGLIPIWLVNMAITQGPLITIKGMLKELRTKNYSQAKLDYIEEK